MDLLSQLMLPLAAAPTPDPDSVRRWSSLLLALTLIGILSVCGLALLLAIRRARIRSQKPRQKASSTTDAWAEAGARAPIPPEDGHDDETASLGPPGA